MYISMLCDWFSSSASAGDILQPRLGCLHLAVNDGVVSRIRALFSLDRKVLHFPSVTTPTLTLSPVKTSLKNVLKLVFHNTSCYCKLFFVSKDPGNREKKDSYAE